MILSRKIKIIPLSICLASFFFFNFTFPTISKTLGLKSNLGNYSSPTVNHNTLNNLKCPKDPETLQKQLMNAYKKLLAVIGTGEGGNMDTYQKREAVKRYKFYANCLKMSGEIRTDTNTATNSFLVSYRVKVDRSDGLVTIDMKIREKNTYESLKRVEISIRDENGKEFFRAMNNRSPKCVPIPPNAFGIYPVGEKKKLSLRNVESAGMEAAITVKNRYGYLIDGCKTMHDKGILAIHWKIHSEGWQFSDGKGYIFVKIVPKRKNDAPWMNCTSFVYKTQQLQRPIHTKSATVKPLICFHGDDCHEADKITLIHFSRQKRKGTMQRWTGDTAYQYQYNEISRETVNITKLPDKMLVLEPGFYQFEYNDVHGDPPAGFYGGSEVFEVKAGNDMEISVWVESAL